ncbi:hypothetical protein QYF36_005866 [Acer negundo]|nr:hypothetical protein QYF36_005866 [Acer negundo]
MNIEIVPNNQTNNCTQLTPTFGSRPGAIADDEAVFPSWKMETYLGLHFLSSMMEIGDPTGSSIADELPNIEKVRSSSGDADLASSVTHVNSSSSSSFSSADLDSGSIFVLTFV